MELRIFTEPQQGASYDTLLAMALCAEEGGFGAFFRSDHYLKMGDGSGAPGPTDAWITLAGLARETSTIRLGTLVNSATFRLPGPLAISVAQVDAMSGGRVELGLGAGWYEQEHKAYAVPFPGLGERFEVLEEQLAIISGLWATEGGFSYAGKHYQVTDSPGLPKPIQRPGPPIIVGGGGPKRTPRLAATYAAEFNAAFRSLDDTRIAFQRAGEACDKIGRERSTLTLSSASVVCCGESIGDIERRAKSIGREVDDLRANGLCGTPAEITAKLTEEAAIGVQRCYLQVLDLADLDHVRLIAADILPAMRSLKG